MIIGFGSDHAGFCLKEELKAFVEELGHTVKDYGTFSTEAVDYPEIGFALGRAVAKGEVGLGIAICGTGIGISIAANKVPGIRAALCSDPFSAKASREHNDANILVLGGRVLGPGLAREIVQVWLTTRFEGGRHVNRLNKIRAIEEKYCRERKNE